MTLRGPTAAERPFMKHRLTGTGTFLFTDIEGSTALLQRLGDQRFRMSWKDTVDFSLSTTNGCDASHSQALMCPIGYGP